MAKEKESKVAVFDLDGTLIDSKPKIITDVQDTMARLGYNISYQESSKDWGELRQQYGISKEDWDRAFEQRKTWEQALREGQVPLFEDALPCLKALRDRKARLALLFKSKHQ